MSKTTDRLFFMCATGFFAILVSFLIYKASIDVKPIDVKKSSEVQFNSVKKEIIELKKSHIDIKKKLDNFIVQCENKK